MSMGRIVGSLLITEIAVVQINKAGSTDRKYATITAQTITNVRIIITIEWRLVSRLV